MPTRNTWEAMDEVRRWLASGGRDRYEIEGSQQMPGFVRSEMAIKDQLPGYETPDATLQYYIESSPTYGGGPRNQDQRRQAGTEQREAMARAVGPAQSRQALQAVGQPSNDPGLMSQVTKYIRDMIGGGGAPGNFGVSSERAGTPQGNPASNVPYGAYPVTGRTGAYGSPTGQGARNVTQGDQFPVTSSLADTNKPLADMIEKVLMRGVLSPLMPSVMRIPMSFAYKGAKGANEARQQQGAANEYMDQQLYADQYLNQPGGITESDIYGGAGPAGSYTEGGYGGYGSLPTAGFSAGGPVIDANAAGFGYGPMNFGGFQGDPGLDMITITTPGANW